MLNKYIVNWLFLFSLLLIVTVTLLYPFPNTLSTTTYHVESNFIPFVVMTKLLTSYSVLYSMYNIIGNIMLFMPLGFLLPIKFKMINKYLEVTLVDFIFSVFIELTH